MSEDGPTERARALSERVRKDPTSFDGDEVRELLDTPSTDARWYALQTLRSASASGTVDLSAFLTRLEASLDDESSRVRSTAAMAVGDLAAREPGAVTDLLEPMTALLDDDQELVRTAVSDFLYRVAAAAGDPDQSVEPETLKPVVPDLRTLLDDPAQRDTAVLALGEIAPTYADRLVDDVEQFRSVFIEATEGPGEADTDNVADHQAREQIQDSQADAKVRRRNVRRAAGRSLVAIARTDSEALVSSVPTLAEHVDAPNPAVRSFVLELFEAVGTDHPDEVEPYLDTIAAHLENEDGVREHAALALTAVARSNPGAVVAAIDQYHDAVVDLLDHSAPAVRGAAVGLLSYVAEESPESVSPEPVRPLLDDDHGYVRGNAIWVLGYLRDETVRDEVRERAESDPNPEVRSAAEAALERL